MTALLAPNGKPSRLTPEQWAYVRLDAFKDWFGDWENDPKDASRVIDENGEPLIVYHGSKRYIDQLQPNGRGLIWATDGLSTAASYAGTCRGAGIRELFLNIRRPVVADFAGAYYYELPAVDGEDYVDRFAAGARLAGNDGAILRDIIDDGGEMFEAYLTTPATNFAVFHPGQVCLMALRSA